jgi:hypothetical protein
MDGGAGGGRLRRLPGSDPAGRGRPEILAFAPTGGAERAPGVDLDLADVLGSSVPSYELGAAGTVPGPHPAGAVVFRTERGLVAVLPYDTGHPSLRGNRRLEIHAEDLFSSFGRGPDPWKAYAGRSWYEWETFASSLEHGLVGYPRTALLLLALVAFIAVAGPVNFVLVRRWHRPAWTVLTVPALGGLTTLVLLLTGWIARDRGIGAHRITVFMLDAGAEDGVVYENLVFATGGRRQAVLRSETGRLGSFSSGQTQARADVAHVGPDADLLWQFEPREPALFYAAGRGTFGAVSARWSAEGGLYGTVTVVNESPHDLEHAVFFQGGSARFIGDVPAGATVRVSDLPAIPLWFPHKDDLDDEERRRMFLAGLDGTLLTGPGFRLAAFARSKRPPPSLDGAPVDLARDETVVVVPVSGGRR